MAFLNDLVEYCQTRTRVSEFVDFSGAWNGVQVANRGEIKKIGACVDAGLQPIQDAIEAGVNFIIVHHGLFWGGVQPVVGPFYDQMEALIKNDCALYSCHLPLDGHREIGNNALIAQSLNLNVVDWICEHEGEALVAVAEVPKEGRGELADRLQKIFPNTYHAIEYGSEKPERVAICSGAGDSALPYLKGMGIDTYITGELRQHAFNYAQEQAMNVYPCGHYATEVYGVCALGQELSHKFNIPFEFFNTECRL